MTGDESRAFEPEPAEPEAPAPLDDPSDSTSVVRRRAVRTAQAFDSIPSGSSAMPRRAKLLLGAGGLVILGTVGVAALLAVLAAGDGNNAPMQAAAEPSETVAPLTATPAPAPTVSPAPTSPGRIIGFIIQIDWLETDGGCNTRSQILTATRVEYLAISFRGRGFSAGEKVDIALFRDGLRLDRTLVPLATTGIILCLAGPRQGESPGGWPPGLYRVDFSLSGQIVGSSERRFLDPASPKP